MKRFKRIYIEITNICNLSCSFCPKTNRKLKFMKQDEFEIIIKKIKPYTDYIYLHLMGEPTLNKELETFLAICEAHNIKVNITTNATLLPKVQQIILNSLAVRQVNLSLHSFEANDSVMTLNQYVLEISDFITQASEAKRPIISIRLWNMDSEQLKGENRLNEDILDLLQTSLNPHVLLREALQESKSLKLRQNVYLNMAEKFEWPDVTKLQSYENVFCHGLRDHIGIQVDGTVVPCCLDSEGSIPLGNIFETDLETIISSSRAVALYEGFSRRCAVEKLCQTCGYATRY